MARREKTRTGQAGMPAQVQTVAAALLLAGSIAFGPQPANAHDYTWTDGQIGSIQEELGEEKSPGGTCGVGEPIDVMTGEFYLDGIDHLTRDLVIPGPGPKDGALLPHFVEI